MVLFAKEITCELCGKLFRCERGIGCWCSTIKLSEKKLSKIRLTANDCVCADCLRDD